MGVGLDFSEFYERATSRLEGDFPYAGQRVILHDERTFEDQWGVIRRVGKDEKYVEWSDGPLANVLAFFETARDFDLSQL